MLTPDLIFERALEIIDAEGLGALSMRRLASSLGVEAASLYHHIRDKQALLDGVIGRARSEMVVTADPMGDWKTFLEEVFLEYRRMLVAHPNLLDLAGWRLENNMEDGLAYLVGIGFSLDDAVEMMQSLVALAVGFAMFGAEEAPKGERGLPPEMAARMSDWREETCARTARLILESYEGSRRAG
ncbi:MAG: TetR family transcriptional regulator [Demequinaceae bacterium]|nr:TetR family transcriptional regulator [Demequinaceae bacterium]